MMDRDGRKDHPVQRIDLDLSQEPRELRRDGLPAPELISDRHSNTRNPTEMMRAMGFDPTKNFTPLQFLMAVVNDDLDMIFKNEKRRERMRGKGGLALSYRIEAAKTAAKFMHKEQPKALVKDDGADNFGESLTKAIQGGHQRITRKTFILEEVENISPDIPLAPASYPPAFADAIEQEDPAAEGDTDYNPDDDD